MSKARQLAQKPSQPTGRKNMVYNGAMTVAQRDDEVTGQTETNGYKTVDRFQFWTYSGGTYTLSQDDTEVPQGFAYSHKVLNTATTTTVAGTGVSFRQRIEAQDLQHLDYNTSNAKSVTLSFWVQSDTTGTYAVRIYNPDSGRMITKTYAISTADTWEKKTITFVGDTSGVINNDTGYAFEIAWWLAAGTDFTSGSASGSWETYSATKEASGHNVSLNSGGDWYITGVQLEVGSTATEFEHRSYGEELQLCRRYYQKYIFKQYTAIATVANWNAASSYGAFYFDVTMRAAPTTFDDNGPSNFRRYQGNTDDVPTSMTLQSPSLTGCEITYNHASDTTGQAGWLRSYNDDASFEFDSEL